MTWWLLVESVLWLQFDFNLSVVSFSLCSRRRLREACRNGGLSGGHVAPELGLGPNCLKRNSFEACETQFKVSQFQVQTLMDLLFSFSTLRVWWIFHLHFDALDYENVGLEEYRWSGGLLDVSSKQVQISFLAFWLRNPSHPIPQRGLVKNSGLS